MMIDRKDKRYVSCPVCGRILMKCQGQCNIDITCGKCNREIVVLVDEEKDCIPSRLQKSIVWQRVANIKNVHAGNITYIIFANVCFNNTYFDQFIKYVLLKWCF